MTQTPGNPPTPPVERPNGNPPESRPSPDPGSPTQTKRRVIYGVNVLVMVLAAVAIVILINLMGSWTEGKEWARQDLTHTRRYSLSEQTRNVLKGLKSDFHLVTLFNGGGAPVDQANALVDLYGQYSDRVKADHIPPALDLGRRAQFCGQLLERYKGRLEPVDAAVRKGLTALENLHQETQEQLTRLRTLQENPALPEGENRKFVVAAVRYFAILEKHLDSQGRAVHKFLDDPLPYYTMALANTRDYLADEPIKVFLYYSQQFTAKALGPGASPPQALAGQVQAIADAFGASLKKLQAVVDELKPVVTVGEYDAIRDQISQDDANVVVVLGPHKVQVLDIQQMFRPPPTGRAAEESKPEAPEFQGEEKITGALVSMAMETPPLVVFVSPLPQSVLEPDKGFSRVAAQLRSMNFRVEEWSPLLRRGPEGPAEPPKPAPGQKTVWVVLASTPASQANPRGGMAADDAVAHEVDAHLGKGDAALLLLSMSRTPGFGDPSAIVQRLESWGIHPQLDRQILREFRGPDGRSQPIPVLEISTWSTDLPVSQALAGMTAYFWQASPIEVDKPKNSSVKVWPLISVAGPNLWADANPSNSSRRDPATAKGSYIISVATQRDKQRVIVFGDPAWALDEVVANIPANSELFTNSVYWLAGQDQLIAASARTQDIRRIHHQFTLKNRFFLSVLMAGGIVVVVSGLGLGVWMVRRKS